VLLEELTALYDAFSARAESHLAPLAIQYGDFAHWQRHWKSHPVLFIRAQAQPQRRSHVADR
jgi:arthrofactin-type cyclic lipopeptide synthetase C